MSNNFLGTGLKFPLGFNDENGFELVSYEEDIKEAIRIILQTAPGERVMRPEFGCGINEYAFSVINVSNLMQIENEVKRSLTLFEPRIVLEAVKASAQTDEDGNGLILIYINYVVKASNGRYNIVYPFYLSEKG